MSNPLYFAYGSNMNLGQMRYRCPGAELEGRATLRGYRLAFGGRSRTWGGAVATIVRDRASEVDGILYRLPRADLECLDRFEGHPCVYVRAPLRVRDEHGRRRQAQVYALPEVYGHGSPGPEYLGVLWLAYDRHGFDSGALVSAALGVAA